MTRLPTTQRVAVALCDEGSDVDGDGLPVLVLLDQSQPALLSAVEKLD